MNRIEIEAQLSRDRAWLLETYAMLSPEDLHVGATPSEHDTSVIWTPLDHLAHLAAIERAFNAMVERHIGGDASPVGLMQEADGTPRTREQIMTVVHRMNEGAVAAVRGMPLAGLIRIGEEARAETMALLARLTDDQLAAPLPGAPWADGTVGGVIATNAAHGRMHWKWLKEGFARLGRALPR